MSEKVKVGVIGLGWPGGMHIQGVWENKKDAQVVAVCDTDDGRCQNMAARFKENKMPVPRLYHKIEDIIADREVDAITVGLPNFLHASVALAALQAGKHVFTEKPPTCNAKEMGKIVQLVEKSGLIYQYVCQRRYQASGLACRKLVADGKLGEVYHAKATWARTRGVPIGAGGWFIDKSRAGGGALIDIGVHMLDAAWYYMGSPKPVSVSAQAGNFIPGAVPKGFKYDVDDFAIALIKFENRATILLEASWSLYQEDAGRHGIQLYGTKAGLLWEPTTLYAPDKDQKVQAIPVKLKPQKMGDFGLMMKHFIACIRTRQEPVSSAWQALDLMKMLDGIYQSAQTGKEVRLK